MILSYLITKRKRSNNLFRGSARVSRAGVTGATPGRGGPLIPRLRGTIYEALPFTRRCFKGTRLSAYPNSSHAISDLELDYELVCKIMDDLELEGRMEISL